MVRMLSATKAQWFGAVLLVLACGSVVYYFFDSVWAESIDFSLHYSLVARLSEHWQLPTDKDPSLGEMNTYPRYAHRLGAIAGNLLGSPMEGMQAVVMLSLAAVWAALGFLWAALPRRGLLVASGALVVLLVVDHFFVHLELFGNELVGNYFYPQVVAQAIVLVLIAAALWMERNGVTPAAGYVMLGLSVPMLQQVHLLPAVEMLGTLSLLVLLNFVAGPVRNRRNIFLFGLFCIAAAVALTVASPAFGTMVKNAYDGRMNLRYTPNAGTLAVESVIVITLSAWLIWRWFKLSRAETGTSLLTLKYLGIFGAATAAMCLVEIVAFLFHIVSLYACQKFAIGMNTTLILELSLMPWLWMDSSRASHADEDPGTVPGWLPELLRAALPALLVLLGFMTVLPAPGTRSIDLQDLVTAERSVKSYTAANPTDNPKKYQYAIGLFPNAQRGHGIFDYLISTGVLETPRMDNADDLLNAHPLSRPNQVGRIYTRMGSAPWDVQACRQAVLDDNIVVLDGQCVVKALEAAGITTGFDASACVANREVACLRT